MAKPLQPGELRFEADGANLHYVPPAPAEPAAEYEDVSLGQLGRDLAKHEEYCWGCRHFCKPEESTKRPALYKMWQCYMMAKGKTSDAVLAEQMARIYQEEIYNKRLAANEPATPWPAAMILVHLREHMLNPRSILYEAVEDARTLSRTLKRTMFRRDLQTQRVEPIEKNVKLFIESQKHLVSMMNANPDKLLEV